MPYRRLPNTDLARLHALQNAIQRAQIADYTEQVLPYKVLSEAQRFLVSFENTVMQSKDNYTSTPLTRLVTSCQPHVCISPISFRYLTWPSFVAR